MENFIVSARKYRPVTFETVVGQEHVTGTLKNAIKNNQLAQAFLFCGPRGVGKTTCARILAKTINCLQPGADIEACGVCESCISFQNGQSFNFHELDAASNNSVDDIRSLIEQVRIPPQAGKYKIYIIDEVHMLSQSAFNAFLKTLEEPPPYAIFILATTEKHKILPTILSRCQIFDFNRIRIEDIAAHLQKIAEREHVHAEADGLHIIAQKADGGLRDALSMFDQIVSYTNKNVTYQSVIANLNILDYDYYFKLISYLTAGSVSETLLLFNEILHHGFDGHHFINGLADHLRNLLVGKDPQTITLLEVSENIKQKYLQQSSHANTAFLLTALNLASQCDLNYKNSKNQRLQVELALIKMCHIPSVIRLSDDSALTASTDESQDKKKTLIRPEENNPQKESQTKSESSIKAGHEQKENLTSLSPVPPPETEADIQELEAFIEKEDFLDLPDTLTLDPVPESNPVKSEEPVINKEEARILPLSGANSIKIQAINASPINSMLIPSLTDLNKVASGLEDTEPKYIHGSEKEKFTEEAFRECWDNYKQTAKDQDKIHLYTLMNNPPQLNGVEITVFADNSALESTLQEEKIDLLNYLRTNLRNFDIEVISKRTELTQQKRIYTDKDKYAYLVEKNPQLDEMRKRFNLDLI